MKSFYLITCVRAIAAAFLGTPNNPRGEITQRFCSRLLAVSITSTACLLSATSLAALAGASRSVQTPDRGEIKAKANAYMEAAVRNDQFSGSILVAHDGKPLVDKAYGMANYELSVPNTPQTVYHIASLTKQFTAMAIMQLQEHGRLNVNDPICKYLDDCPTAWQPITIHHLLTHSSGIPNFTGLPTWDEVLGRKTYRHSELVRLFHDLPLEFTPGEEFRYSNSGYHLLGLIIERASGKSYGQFLRDGIFAPLGMDHTTYDDNRNLIPGRATGYYSRGTSFVTAPYIDLTTTYADGGITSTTGDLLRWDQALYSSKLVSEESLEKIFTPYKDTYGYGWDIDEQLERRAIHHSGSFSGFSSYILRFPAERVTVIVLSNSDRTSATKAGMNLARIVFGLPYDLPKPQLGDILWDMIMQRGVAAAVKEYRELRRAEPNGHDFDEDTLLELGYYLIDGRKLSEAVAILELNLEYFPKSAYTYDGLADVAGERSDEQKAIAYFRKSLSLDPENDYARQRLMRLRAGEPLPR